jgi:hypothetical protein
MRWLSLLLIPSVLFAGGFTIGGSGSVTVGGASGSVETDGYYEKIPIYYTAGRVNFSAADGGAVTWYFHDGTTSSATSFDSTFAADGVVYLETDLTDPGLEISDGATNARFAGDLSVFRRLTNYLNLSDCSHVTGDLSDVSGVTRFLSLANCPNVTGDLSDVSGLTYLLSLANCTNITGDLSDVSGLTYYLYLINCTNITGILDPHPTLARIWLDNTNTSASDISQSLVNLEAVTTVTGARTFQATHVNYTDLTAAGQTAADNLATAGWTITLGDGVVP